MSGKYEAAMMINALDRLEEAMEHREPISFDLFREILKRNEQVPQCVHLCDTAEHLLFAHDDGDESGCDQLERLIANGAAHCEECRGQ